MAKGQVRGNKEKKKPKADKNAKKKHQPFGGRSAAQVGQGSGQKS
jgi:hypothetical protein